MQFGKALNRIMTKIVESDPRHGPVYMIKVDVADGFYRIHLCPHQIPALGVAFPPAPDGTELVAFPLVLPMGWVESLPLFCAATETIADLANSNIRSGVQAGPHRLREVANTPPDPNEAPILPPANTHILSALEVPSHSLGPRKRPVKYVDVYVDDFIGLAQGGPKARDHIRDNLFASIDQVFRPALSDEGKHRQEPSSTKKLGKGDGHWATQKKILGWFLDTVQGTIQLPQRRIDRLLTILQELPRTKRRIAVTKWQKILGELRSMVLAVPGLRGLFSLLQEALRHQEKARIKLSQELHDFLDDIRWVVNDLGSRPTRFLELIPTPLATIGASDACGVGMGGVFFVPTEDGYISYLWRQKFPDFITEAMVSWQNPSGNITNSDLELAATIAQHDVITQHIDIRERTVHTLTDNTPTAAWQTKGSTTTTGAAAYLLRLQALHQRHYRYLVRHSHIRGECNIMADDCSRLWHFTDDQLLSHFSSKYPQMTSWWLSLVPPKTHFSLISALQKQRPDPGSWLRTHSPKIVPGKFGSNSVPSLAKTQTYKTSPNPSPCFKSTQDEFETAGLPPAVNPSNLLQWIAPFWPSVRKSPCWGPQIRG
jgi:hypothetical protein